MTSFDLNSKENTPVANIESDGIQVLQNQPKHIYHNIFNPTALEVLMNYEFEEGCAVLMIIKKDHQKQFVAEQRKFDQLKNAVFISKDKICALTNKGSLYLYSFDGKSKQVDWIKDSTIDNIYQATVGKILVKC